MAIIHTESRTNREPNLVRSGSVLYLAYTQEAHIEVPIDGEVVVFEAPDKEEHEDDRTPGKTVYLPVDTWKEMGEPEVITAFIHPGDLLNEESEE